MKPIICSDMVREYLEKNGYDGLVNEHGECGCVLDDLMPCGGDYAMDCEAGHKVSGCSPECSLGCDFHVVSGKKSKENH